MTAQTEADVEHLLPLSATLDAFVAERREAADGVAHLTLRPAGGGLFPAWEAGAHIDLHLPGLTRQYSICSSPANRASLEIAVLREPESRGGSAYVHDALTVGTRVVVGGPRNNFSLAPSRKYLFIAGGIGITPMLAMIEAAEQAGKEWRLAYGGRSLATMAFAQELLDAYGTERVLLFPSEESGRLDLEALLGVPRALTLVYACGPQRLLDAIEDYCLGWPAGALHLERFAATGGGGSAGPFEVELGRTGRVIEVAADRTVLDAVEEAGVRVLSSCRQGVCGTCEVPVLAGEVDHRDAILTPEDRARSATMMVCVSRAAAGCSRLTLDL